MNFKISVVTILFNLISNQSYSQYVTLVSNNTSGSKYISDLIQHTNSNYYTTGMIDSGPFGNWDILVTKMDTNNNLIWSKIYGDTTYNSAQNIVELSDSNILVTAYSFSPPSRSCATIIKLNISGDTIWTKNILDSASGLSLNYLSHFGDSIILYGIRANDTLSKGIIVAISSLTGEIFWSKSYQIPGYLKTLFSKGITRKVTNKSFLLVHTETDSITTLRQAFLCTLDGTGNVISVKYIADSCDFRSPILKVSEQTGDVFIGINNFRYSGLLLNYLFCLIDSIGQLRYSKESVAHIGSRSFESALIIDSMQSVIVSNGSNIYLLDSTGNVAASNKVYHHPAFPAPLVSISKMLVNSNKLVTAGSLRKTNNPPINLFFIKSELDGTGCHVLPFIDSTVNVPVAMTNYLMNVDTLTSLYATRGINYSPFLSLLI